LLNSPAFALTPALSRRERGKEGGHGGPPSQGFVEIP